MHSAYLVRVPEPPAPLPMCPVYPLKGGAPVGSLPIGLAASVLRHQPVHVHGSELLGVHLVHGTNERLVVHLLLQPTPKDAAAGGPIWLIVDGRAPKRGTLLAGQLLLLLQA